MTAKRVENIGSENTRSLLWNSEDTRPISGQPGSKNKGENCYVIVRENDAHRWLYRLSYKHSLLVGRHYRCDIIVEDLRCSRVHCELQQAAGQWQVIHKSETNPTRVNGEEVKSKFLADGDEIRVGKTIITFYNDQPELQVGHIFAGCCDI